MQSEYFDMRIIKTRESIYSALINLLETKSFKEITVKDITNLAKINRSTFYAHYQDKYDLINKYQNEFFNGLENITSTFTYSDITDKNLDIVRNMSERVLTYFYENKSFLKAVLCKNGDLEFQNKLKDFFWETFFGDDDNLLFEFENNTMSKNYLFAFMSSAQIGVIQEWINNDCKESPSEIADIVSVIITGVVYSFKISSTK